MDKNLGESKVREILRLLSGVSFRDWQIIERYINDEYKRQANLNTLANCETVLKNIMLDR